MKNTKKQRLFEITSLQQGYFTAKQAVHAGYSYRLHTHYKQSGQWLVIDRGVFRLVQFPNSPDEDYVRWSLWSRDRNGELQAVISHESALSIHNLSDVMPSKIHFTFLRDLGKNHLKDVSSTKGECRLMRRSKEKVFLLRSLCAQFLILPKLI